MRLINEVVVNIVACTSLIRDQSIFTLIEKCIFRFSKYWRSRGSRGQGNCYKRYAAMYACVGIPAKVVNLEKNHDLTWKFLGYKII
jgi:hypothetical protein